MNSEFRQNAFQIEYQNGNGEILPISNSTREILREARSFLQNLQHDREGRTAFLQRRYYEDIERQIAFFEEQMYKPVHKGTNEDPDATHDKLLQQKSEMAYVALSSLEIEKTKNLSDKNYYNSYLRTEELMQLLLDSILQQYPTTDEKLIEAEAFLDNLLDQIYSAVINGTFANFAHDYGLDLDGGLSKEIEDSDLPYVGDA